MEAEKLPGGFRGGQAVSPGPENITATRQVRTCAVVGLSADAPGKDEPETTRPLMAGWPGWCARERVLFNGSIAHVVRPAGVGADAWGRYLCL